MEAQFEPVSSLDVLFPEEEPQQTYLTESYYGQSSRSPFPSRTHEVKYITESDYSSPRMTRLTENNNYKQSNDDVDNYPTSVRSTGYSNMTGQHSRDPNTSQTSPCQSWDHHDRTEDVYSQPLTGYHYNRPRYLSGSYTKLHGSQTSLYRENENGYPEPSRTCKRDICVSGEGSPGNRRPIIGCSDSRGYHSNCHTSPNDILCTRQNSAETSGGRQENDKYREKKQGMVYSPTNAHQSTQDSPHKLHRARHGYVNTQDNPGKYVNFICRRRTWSPPTFSKVLGIFGSFPMRSYRSNDQLDVDADADNCYEVGDSSLGPPRIAPVSGMLDKTTNNLLIRPIAFKPIITPGLRYGSPGERHVLPHNSDSPDRQHISPTSSHDRRVNSQNQEDGFLSPEYHNGSCNQNTSNLSQNSVHVESEIPIYQESQKLSSQGRTDSFNSSGHSNHSHCSRISRISGVNEGYLATPSPSDSGVELEAMLREKDAEIASLRSRMEQNEAVIIDVYKEKEQNWEVEIKEVAAAWDARVHQQQAKAFKTEQALLLQLFKLQQDRKALRQDVGTLCAQREQAEQRSRDLMKEATVLQARAEELSWELGQKVGELSLLKAQLKDTKEESANRANDLLGVCAQLKDAAIERDEKNREINRLQSELSKSRQEVLRLQTSLDKAPTSTNKSVSDQCLQTDPADVSTVPPDSPCAKSSCQCQTTRLQTELQLLRGDQEKYREDYEKERERWLEEKNKVICYQKHLQLNYVQMYRKNQRLESEIEQLMLEAENRELKLTPMHGGEKAGVQGDDVIESTC